MGIDYYHNNFRHRSYGLWHHADMHCLYYSILI